MTHSISGKKFFCSWSGGKDSCLAFYHAVRAGGKPACLFTMMVEDGGRSRSHALPRALLEQQAQRLGLPIVFRSASWNDYESEFISAMREFKQKEISCGVFGDIDIESHRDWVWKVCNDAGTSPYHPLWQRDRRDLLSEFIKLDFQASIIVVKDGVLDKRFLNRTIDKQTMEELYQAGIDAAGERGEYHTVVTGGPLFSSAMHLITKGVSLHDGYWFLEVDTTN
ncbi:MAG: diphthine--ammonia ligase [Gammaproteobacteria bacterium]|nr:diphthine--ammonia ligase [Gammaproteobacteria bacterium]